MTLKKCLEILKIVGNCKTKSQIEVKRKIVKVKGIGSCFGIERMLAVFTLFTSIFKAVQAIFLSLSLVNNLHRVAG